MKKNLITAVVMTIATTILLGIVYPLVVTGIAQVIFPKRANGQLIQKDGKTLGSRIIGQGFSGPAYFHSRPSAAGNGYDAGNSGGSNLGPTNQKLVDRVHQDVARLQEENPGRTIPIDLVTTSASGFDPHITPAAAEFQLPRIAKERGTTADQLRAVVAKHTEGRQLGMLGEPRVDVLELNLELDKRFASKLSTRDRQSVKK
ncbi:MAG TPA: potassium-transporting ATPase subunit KdpC [Terriglobales bacterium]|nr:potassium-transporting ATPase subunit KdpC [Terriglobales bacterium]